MLPLGVHSSDEQVTILGVMFGSGFGMIIPSGNWVH